MSHQAERRSSRGQFRREAAEDPRLRQEHANNCAPTAAPVRGGRHSPHQENRSSGGTPIGQSAPAESADLAYRQLRRDVIAFEAVEPQRLYDEHAISDTTRRMLQRSLDLEEARLTDI